MIISELTSLLAEHPEHAFQLLLPSGTAIPMSFHITEVGRVEKVFIDCGGTTRQITTCQLQVWVGQDFDHRIETGKMAGILRKSATILPDTSIPVEIEYQDRVTSVYKIAKHEITENAVVITLASKQTECLAPELCGLEMPQFARGIDFQPTLIPQKCSPNLHSTGCC